MRRPPLPLTPLVFVAAAVLYLPSLRYGYVQDDRAIIVSNPAAHSIGRALRAFDEPYWPAESGAGLYRPVTILSYAVDWTLSGGSPAWMHLVNALLHAAAALLFTLVLARWLAPLAAALAGLLFAWHPVHVEAVANLVGRAELLAAMGILGAVLAARRGRWALAVACAAFAMLSKEHGVVVGVVLLLDRWLLSASHTKPPRAFWIALAAVTAAFVAAWLVIGRSGTGDVAAVFYGRGTLGRWAVALPAVARAAGLLVWPGSLSSDYGPQVIAAYEGLSFAAVLGLLIAGGVAGLVWWCRRRAPAIAFAAGLAALSYLPTSNLVFASGVVLAERNLYLAVALPAALVGTGFAWLELRRGIRPAIAAVGLAAIACGAISWRRLPTWRDNRAQLLTLLVEHPESYRAHASAAAVLAGSGDTAGARNQYRIADSLYRGDPHVDAAYAIFLLTLGDTAGAAPLVARLGERPAGPAARNGLKARFLLQLRRGDRIGAHAVADTALGRFPGDTNWYRQYLQ